MYTYRHTYIHTYTYPYRRPRWVIYRVTYTYGRFFIISNLKLSVSNPRSKYVAYVSVLSRTSNCQGLGRKNKHEILKTDRTIIIMIITILLLLLS